MTLLGISCILSVQKTQTLSRFLPLLLHQQLVRHKRYKFAIGGLVVLAVDVVAEEGVEVLDLAPGPGHLDGVADGPLHLAGGGVEALGDARIQLLGDPVDQVRVVVDQSDALPEVVEAILSRRNYPFLSFFDA